MKGCPESSSLIWISGDSILNSRPKHRTDPARNSCPRGFLFFAKHIGLRGSHSWVYCGMARLRWRKRGHAFRERDRAPLATTGGTGVGVLPSGSRPCTTRIVRGLRWRSCCTSARSDSEAAGAVAGVDTHRCSGPRCARLYFASPCPSS